MNEDVFVSINEVLKVVEEVYEEFYRMFVRGIIREEEYMVLANWACNLNENLESLAEETSETNGG